jgi:DNA polymerase-1
MSEPSFLAVDGTGLLVRCCRAPRARELHASDGTPTGALMMFIASLSRAVKLLRPSHMLVAWDGVNCLEWRRGIYPPYKAGRSGFDAEQAEARQVMEFLATAGIPQCRIPAFEADDVLAAAARAALGRFMGAILHSDDADLLQLAGLRETRVYRDHVLTDMIDVKAEWGVSGARLTMLRALEGDKSDNIAGVPRVGRKRAMQLLEAGRYQWPLPKGILSDPDDRAVAEACYRVMDLRAPERRPEETYHFDSDVTKCAWNPPAHSKVLPLLERYELSAIAERSRTGNLW